MARQIIADRGTGSRWERATRLYEDGYFERLSADVFIVQMPGDHEPHTVNLETHECDCEDFDFHRHLEAFACYHLIAARMYQVWLRKAARGMVYLFREAS